MPFPIKWLLIDLLIPWQFDRGHISSRTTWTQIPIPNFQPVLNSDLYNLISVSPGPLRLLIFLLTSMYTSEILEWTLSKYVCTVGYCQSINQSLNQSINSSKLYCRPYCEVSLHTKAVETHLKKPMFWGFLENLKTWKVRFLGFLIFKSEFLLFHVKLKFLLIIIHRIYNVQHSAY